MLAASSTARTAARSRLAPIQRVLLGTVREGATGAALAACCAACIMLLCCDGHMGQESVMTEEELEYAVRALQHWRCVSVLLCGRTARADGKVLANSAIAEVVEDDVEFMKCGMVPSVLPVTGAVVSAAHGMTCCH